MTMNWLEGVDDGPEQGGRAMARPVFAGQKLVVVGGSSGMGRQTAADVVAAGGSAVIIGQDAPTSTASSVRVTLDKVGGRWLISQFDPV